jgi:hypothetical protein
MEEEKPYCPRGWCGGRDPLCNLCKEYNSRWKKAYLLNIFVMIIWVPFSIYLFITNMLVCLAFVAPSAIILWKLERKWWKKIMGKYYNAFKK